MVSTLRYLAWDGSQIESLFSQVPLKHIEKPWRMRRPRVPYWPKTVSGAEHNQRSASLDAQQASIPGSQMMIQIHPDTLDYNG